MERRKEPRFKTNQPAELRILDDGGTCQATLLEISGKGLRVRVDGPLKLGAPVRLDVEQTIILGEVTHSTSSADGYEAGIQVEQVLTKTDDLTRLIEALKQPATVTTR